MSSDLLKENQGRVCLKEKSYKHSVFLGTLQQGLKSSKLPYHYELVWFFKIKLFFCDWFIFTPNSPIYRWFNNFK